MKKDFLHRRVLLLCGHWCLSCTTGKAQTASAICKTRRTSRPQCRSLVAEAPFSGTELEVYTHERKRRMDWRFEHHFGMQNDVEAP